MVQLLQLKMHQNLNDQLYCVPKRNENVFVYTFPMGLCFNDLTNASWPHCILGCECELVPGATLEVLQPIGALTGTDGKVTPLLAVILRVLQNVAWKRTSLEIKLEEEPFGCYWEKENNWNKNVKNKRKTRWCQPDLWWSCLHCLQGSRRVLLRWLLSWSLLGVAGQVELKDRKNINNWL